MLLLRRARRRGGLPLVPAGCGRGILASRPSPSPPTLSAPAALYSPSGRCFRSSSVHHASGNASSGSDPPSSGSGGGSGSAARTGGKRPRPTPPGTFVWRDVQYHHEEDGGAATDPRKHQLDVYVAKTPFPRPPQPVLLFVHGGLWVRGDRQHPFIPSLYDNVGAACARAGVVGVVISYRLAPHVSHPHQCLDVARALRWTHAHAARFGGDPTRMVLAGASAGAHLLTTLLASPDLLHDIFDPPSLSLLFGQGGHLRGVIGLSGVYNLERLMHKGGGALAASSLLPAVFGDDPRKWPGASPTHLLRAHVQRRSTALLPLQRTPLLLLNAQADFHLEEDTAELLEVLAEGDGKEEGGNGVPPRTTHVVADTDHISLVREVGKGTAVDELIFGFLRGK